MTREEYAKRMKKRPDWAPGWDAIDAAFAKLYPEAEPVRFESEPVSYTHLTLPTNSRV